MFKNTADKDTFLKKKKKKHAFARGRVDPPCLNLWWTDA